MSAGGASTCAAFEAGTMTGAAEKKTSESQAGREVEAFVERERLGTKEGDGGFLEEKRGGKPLETEARALAGKNLSSGTIGI